MSDGKNTILTVIEGVKTCYTISCSICSQDEYVQNGLCSGVFVQNKYSFHKGCLPCRCSNRPPWTQAQREYQIEKIIVSNSLPYQFGYWSDGYTNNRSKVVISCDAHGEFEVEIADFLRKDTPRRCPACAGRDFKYVYLMQVEHGSGTFLKYGITSSPQSRCRHLRHWAKCPCKILKVYKMPSKESCLDFEEKARFIPRVWDQKSKIFEGSTEVVAAEHQDCLEKIVLENGGNIVDSLVGLP